MGKRLFGTDGVRGVAGEFPLDPRTVHALGAALADAAGRLEPSPEVVIGMDTRESGPWLAAQVAGGLSEHGARLRFAGVTTTPGVAYLTRTGAYVAGVMISASHNPYRDNGIKIFSHSGYKLPDEQEQAIEREIFTLLEAGVEPAPVPLAADPGLDRHYVNHLASTVRRSLAGLEMVVDCGNGAASGLAPELFERLGARVAPLCCNPNGRNINLGCGALDVSGLRETVLARGAHLGVAFDGDADRAIFVSRSGAIVNGDGVLLLAARWLDGQGRLSGPEGHPTVVGTVMANLGLERALGVQGIRLLRTPVGDKYVLEEMLRTGAVLGGEQSGHIIFSEYSTTGDGLLTALRVLEIMQESGRGLDELTGDLEIYPQRLVNVRIKERKPLAEMPAVVEEIRAAEQALGGLGRVLVRFSGTEPLARVMIEGPDAGQVADLTGRIAAAIQRELGA
ncbi:MAG: phosphoglucosamine mutase [Bryobacteraceae bacterium]